MRKNTKTISVAEFKRLNNFILGLLNERMGEHKFNRGILRVDESIEADSHRYGSWDISFYKHPGTKVTMTIYIRKDKINRIELDCVCEDFKYVQRLVKSWKYLTLDGFYRYFPINCLAIIELVLMQEKYVNDKDKNRHKLLEDHETRFPGAWGR